MPFYAVVDPKHTDSYPFYAIEAVNLEEANSILDSHAKTLETLSEFFESIFGEGSFEDFEEELTPRDRSTFEDLEEQLLNQVATPEIDQSLEDLYEQQSTQRKFETEEDRLRELKKIAIVRGPLDILKKSEV